MLDIEIKDNGLAAALAAAGHDVGPAVERALNVGARRLLQAKQTEVAKTYARPIPRSKNGKPKWSRSGDFQRDQGISNPEDGVRIVGALGNSEAYEERLATLPKGADGINRTNAAAENAYDKVIDQVGALFEQELLNAVLKS